MVRMKAALVLLFVGFTTVLAVGDDFNAANDIELENFSVDDDFEGIIVDGEYNQEVFSQVALSIIRTGRPNCTNRDNWGRRFRHNWYVNRFWECNRFRTDLQDCAIPRLFLPSLERCVWPWNWRWEPIQGNGEVLPPPPSPTWTPTLTPPWTPETTTPTASPTTPPPTDTTTPPTTTWPVTTPSVPTVPDAPITTTTQSNSPTYPQSPSVTISTTEALPFV